MADRRTIAAIMMRLLVIALVGCGGAKPPATSSPSLDVESSCTHNLSPIDGGQLVVDTRWRGLPVKVLLDTGASLGGVSQPFAIKQGLTSVGTGKRMGLTGPQHRRERRNCGAG